MKASLLNALAIESQIRAYGMNADNQHKALMGFMPDWRSDDFLEISRGLKHRIDALLNMSDYAVASLESIDDI